MVNANPDRNDQMPDRPGLTLLHSHLEGSLDSAQVSIYWKDLSGKYLDANERFLRHSGMPSYSELIGATDRDMAWHKEAETLIENDQRIITNDNPIALFEKALEQDYLSYKSPLYNRDGKVIGIFCVSKLIDTNSCFTKLPEEVSLFGGREAANMMNHLLLKYRQSKTGLSKRQLECVQLLLKGMPLKRIAKRLSLSPRTVEHHIETAKIKLTCYSRVELIEKALALGLDH